MPGIVVAAQEGIEAQQASKENRNGDKVNLPTNDITREWIGNDLYISTLQ